MKEPPSPLHAFPTNRVQKLISRSQFQGMSTKVDVEGLFIQLNEDGTPYRQVFLALTQSDMFIVKQEISTFVPNAHGEMDSDIGGLSIDKILPLPFIHFLILDDNTKYLTIITYNGKKYRFEMCQLDSGSIRLWKKWRESIMTLSGDPKRKEYDPEVWKTSNVISLHNGTANKVNSMEAKTRQFMSTRTFDIQTSPRENAKNRTDTVKAGVNEKETESVSSASSEFGIFKKTTLGYRLSDRLCVLFTRSEFTPHNNTEFNVRLHVKESTDLQVQQEMDDMTETGEEELLHTYTEDRDQSMLLRKTKSLNDLFAGRCQVLDNHTTKLSLKGKDFQGMSESLTSNSNSSLDSDSSADSDDEVLKGIPCAMELKGKDRTAKYLWNLVRAFFIKRKKYKVIGRFQDVVRQVHFRILSQRDIYLAQSVIQLDAMDVSLQLTKMSRKLFLALSITDLEIFTHSQGQDIRRPLERILKFSEDVRKMVITEVLKPRSLSGSVYVLKFFIQVGLKLMYLLHDFNSFVAIVRGLTSLPLYHLDRIWLALFIQEPFSFCHFLTIRQFGHLERQNAAYVTRVNTCLKRKVPFVPLLDHILEHCTKEGNNKQRFKTQSHNNDECTKSTNLVNMKRKASSMPSIDAIPEFQNREIISVVPEKHKLRADNQSPSFELKRTRSPKSKGPYTETTNTKEINKKFPSFRAAGTAVRFLLNKKSENKSTRSVQEVSKDINTESKFRQVSPRSVIPESLSSDKGVARNYSKRQVKSKFQPSLGIDAEQDLHPMTTKFGPITPQSYSIKANESILSSASNSQGSPKKEIGVNDHQRRIQETSESKIQDVDSPITKEVTGELDKDDEIVKETRTASLPVISLRPIFSQNIRKRHSLNQLVLEGCFKEMVLARVNKISEKHQHNPCTETDKREQDQDESISIGKNHDSVINIDRRGNVHSNRFTKESVGRLIENEKELFQNQDTANDFEGDHKLSLKNDFNEYESLHVEGGNIFRNCCIKKGDSASTDKKGLYFVPEHDTNIGDRNDDSFEASLYSARIFLTHFERNIKQFPQLIHYFKYKLSNIERSVLQESNKSYISMDVGLLSKKCGRFGERRKIPQDYKRGKLQKQKKIETANKTSKSDIENEKVMQSRSEANKNTSFKEKILKTFGKAKKPDAKQVLQNDIDQIAGIMGSLEINDSEDDVSISSLYQSFANKTSINQSHSEKKAKTKPNNSKDHNKSIVANYNRNKTECQDKKEENDAKYKFANVQREQKVTKPFLGEDENVFSDRTKGEVSHNGMLNSGQIVSIPTKDEGILDTRASKDKSGMNSKTDFTYIHRKKLYRPEVVERGGRKSMFEESLTSRYQENDTDIFEHLKQAKMCGLEKKMCGLEKKKSIVLDLLSQEEEPDCDEDSNSEPFSNISKRSLIESVTNLFKHNNKNNNLNFVKTEASDSKIILRKSVEPNNADLTNKFEESNKPTYFSHDDFNQDSLLVLFGSGNEIESEQSDQFEMSDINYSQNNNGIILMGDINSGSCSLCNSKECLYQFSVGNHILNAQIKLLNVRIQPCHRVKDFLKSVFTVNSYLTDFDLLQLSNQTG